VNFSDAVDFISRGHLARRESWPEGVFILALDSSDMPGGVTIGAGDMAVAIVENGEALPWIPSVEALLARDWEPGFVRRESGPDYRAVLKRVVAVSTIPCSKLSGFDLGIVDELCKEIQAERAAADEAVDSLEIEIDFEEEDTAFDDPEMAEVGEADIDDGDLYPYQWVRNILKKYLAATQNRPQLFTSQEALYITSLYDEMAEEQEAAG